MKPVRIIEQQDFEFGLDDFYEFLTARISQANPRSHMSADYLRDPLGMGLQLFPVRTYEILEGLKHEWNSGSRGESAAATEGARAS